MVSELLMSRESVLEHLRSAIPVIAPSMLKCDFGRLDREVRALEAAGVATLHLDVMDGHFVPNLTYGPAVISRMRTLTDLPFEAHLMISDPARYLDDFLQAGCQCVTIHVESESDPCLLLRRIRDAGAVAGLALKPGTDVAAIEPLLPQCDLVLVMSVEPGFGGQSFQSSAIDKLQWLSRHKPAEMLLAVDGGINAATIGRAAQAGAEMFVVGSAIFEASDYHQAVEELLRSVADAPPRPARYSGEVVSPSTVGPRASAGPLGE